MTTEQDYIDEWISGLDAIGKKGKKMPKPDLQEWDYVLAQIKKENNYLCYGSNKILIKGGVFQVSSFYRAMLGNEWQISFNEIGTTYDLNDFEFVVLIERPCYKKLFKVKSICSGILFDIDGLEVDGNCIPVDDCLKIADRINKVYGWAR